MEEEDTFFLINPTIRVNLLRAVFMVKESLKVRMVHLIADNGKIIECMAKAFMYTRMGVNMKVKWIFIIG